MRVIVAGSRAGVVRSDVDHALARASVEGIVPTVVISGGAAGADAYGEDFARECHIPMERYPADWVRHGNKAGPVRNAEMAQKADALVAVWDGQSKGTLDMIRRAKARGLKVFVYRVPRI